MLEKRRSRQEPARSNLNARTCPLRCELVTALRLAQGISAKSRLTYLATGAFAASLGRVQWLGLRATRAFMIVTGVALLFLVIRGLHYPDPRALSTPWYTSPGFVVGIPAVPFIMPFLFGVVLLRRAGEEQP